jgi:hypothetical protein
MNASSVGLKAVMLAMVMISNVVSADMQPAEAMQWWSLFRDAMVRGERAPLDELLSEQARIIVRVHEPDLPMQSFTLSPERFSQQLVMMARFATRQQRQMSAPRVQGKADGSVLIQLDITEQRQLFGVDQQQRDQLQILLERQHNGIRAVQIVTDTWIR